MKIYSWKALIVTILLGGGMIVKNFSNMMSGDWSGLVSIFIWGYLIFRGLRVSFTEEGFEEDKRRVAISKRVHRKLFGSWAIIAPWGSIILILLAAVTVYFMPTQKWVTIILMLSALVYAVSCGMVVQKHMKIEEEISKYHVEL